MSFRGLLFRRLILLQHNSFFFAKKIFFKSVTLFEQGYGKDPASIAQAAINLATERNIEVVLVDTAGRMQDNEPLMRALSKVKKSFFSNFNKYESSQKYYFLRQ